MQKGCDVEVVCTDPTGRLPKEANINEVKVTRFRSFAPNEAFYFAPRIYTYLKKVQGNIIHAHSYHAFPALFASIAKMDRKFIFTPHYHAYGHTFFRNLLHIPYKFIGSKIFERSDKVICVSKYEMDLIKKNFKVSDSKLIKIPNGINLKEFDFIENIFKDYKIMLYVGRLEKYKGVQYAIEALSELKDYHLEIIGKGPYEKELKKLAMDLKVYDRIYFYKDLSIKELLRHYKSADVFLMLSKHEAYGITVAEALASGTPCIVAKGSALEEFVDGKMCIGLDYPINIDKLINAILKQTDLDNKVKSLRSSVKLQSWDEVTERILKEVYEV